jgi:ribose transport system ATP-binding protein
MLRMRGVVKRFPGVVALRGVTMEVGRGETHALLGENGAGKSTLIKLLGGIETPDEGEIELDGRPYRPTTCADAYRAGVRVVHQELSVLPHLSVAENLLFEDLPQRRGMVRIAELHRKAAALLDEIGLDVAPTTRADRLSVAQLQLVEIAKALYHDGRLLILDEPTATLTPKEIGRLFEILLRLRERGVTLIYISHRLGEIFELCERVTVLRDGSVVATRPLAGLTSSELVRMMVGRTIADEHTLPSGVEVGSEILRVEGLRRSRSLPAVSFSLRRGEIVGVAGLVGSGRTETMRALVGADPMHEGRIQVDGQAVAIRSPKDAVGAGLCLLTEDRKAQGLMLGLSCAENITITDLAKVSRLGVVRPSAERAAAEALVQKLRIKTPSIAQAVRNLSGGNQQKVVLAKWLFRGAKVLICDEPTRGIDVGAKEEIYRLLWEFAAGGCGVLVVSSDLPELLGLCNRILVFAHDRIVGEVPRPEFDQHRILSLAYEETDLELHT